jgi:hypothetical protein
MACAFNENNPFHLRGSETAACSLLQVKLALPVADPGTVMHLDQAGRK